MTSFFNDLYDYNYHYNKLIIDTALANRGFSKEATRLFSHILNTHQRWNAILLETVPEYDSWQIHKPTQWEELHYDTQRTTFGIITSTENFDKAVSYQDQEGHSFMNSLHEVLFHIINHSTHHRAQIITMLAGEGISLKPTDYIFYKQ